MTTIGWRKVVCGVIEVAVQDLGARWTPPATLRRMEREARKLEGDEAQSMKSRIRSARESNARKATAVAWFCSTNATPWCDYAGIGQTRILAQPVWREAAETVLSDPKCPHRRMIEKARRRIEGYTRQAEVA